MASINQIQKAIIEMEGGKFQRLIDALIAAKGVTSIFSIGSVLGTNKTRIGTPDTITIIGDDISFIEYSTQQSGLFEKFDDDITKCLDEKKTGIDVNCISKIILAYNGRLTTKEIYGLKAKWENSNLSLEFMNLDSISYDLFNHFPGLISEFLGLSIDTGQVLTISEFVHKHDSNALAAKLETLFVGRSKVRKDIIEAITANKITVISGRAGLGKTRLAIECCEEYAKENNCSSHAILDKGMNLFEDLQVYFSSLGDYIILVDDANKVSNYEYFIDLVLHKKGNIKLVVTVRDYAKDDILKLSKRVQNSSHFELDELKNEDIREIITINYPIRNNDYIDRILKISSGNARLAIMASELALKENKLDVLNNVFSLFDAYYSSIIEELSTEKYDRLLKFAGIVSFIKIIDFEKHEDIELLKNVFGYDENELIRFLNELHMIEIVDAYENTIYKVSDQVLSTYLFYYVFMHKGILDISSIFRGYFFKDSKSVIEIINSVASSFYSEDLVYKLRKQAKELYIHFNDDNNKKQLILRAFGGLLPNEVLRFFKEGIELTEEVKIGYKDLEKDKNENLQDYLLEIASTLSKSEYPIKKMLFELIISYVNKNNSKYNDTTIIMKYVFGLNKDNVRSNFELQKDVVDWFIIELDKYDSDATRKIFIEYCRNILEIEIEYTEWGLGNQVIFGRIIVPHNKYSISMRRNTIEKLFSEISDDSCKFDSIKIITSMYDAAYTADFGLFLKDEQDILYKLLKQTLNEDEIKFFVEVSHLINLYDMNDLDSITFENLLKGKLWDLYLIITPERLRREYRNLSYDERVRLKNNLIEQYLTALNANEVISITHGFCVLYSYKEIRSNLHDLRESFHQFLMNVIGCGNKLILEVLEVYFTYNDEILYCFDDILYAINDADLLNELENIILDASNSVKRDKWLFMFIKVATSDLGEQRLTTLTKMFELAEIDSLPRDIFFYLSSMDVKDHEIVNLFKIIMKRGISNRYFYNNLDGLFFEREQLKYSFMDIYTLDPNLVEEL